MADSSEPMPIYEGRNARPWTARPDWIAFAPISPTARELYTVLAGHKNQGRGDQTVWPSRDVLAEILGYSQGRKIDRFLEELIEIDAIARIATRSHGGMRAKNAYVVHADPPDGWTYPVSYGEFYARRRQQQEAESEKSQVTPVVPTQAPRDESEKSQVTPVVPTRALPEVPTRALPEVPTRALEPDEVEPDEFQPTSARGRAGAGWLESRQDSEGEDGASPADDSRGRAHALLDGLVMPKGEQYRPQRADIGKVAEVLDAGVDPERIESEILSGLEGAERPAAAVGTRCRGLSKLAHSSTTHSGSQGSIAVLPEWCGQCDGEDPAERFVERDGRRAHCECHPNHPSRRPSVPAAPTLAEQADPHGVLAQAGITG